MTATVATPGADRFACAAPMRAWPYLVALSLVAGTLIAVAHVGRRASELPGWGAARVLVMLVALALAVAIVRLGASLQWAIRVEAAQLVFERGARRRPLPFESIVQLGWEPVGSSRRALVSALTIEDRGGRLWRIPAVVGRGDALLCALIDAAGREDLAAWDEALRLRPRLARSTLRATASYAALAAWIAAVVFFVAT